MKTSLAHLPKNKRNELTRIVERIRERVDSIQMIILFGSYARGNWVDDTCTKGHITYEYISDFDILAIVETNKIANSTNLWRRLDKSINAMHLLTPVTIIAHDINFVNRKLKNGQYFFTDIKKEGITLYDSGNFAFAAQASALALKSGVSANAKYENGVAVFTMSEAGLMYEASIGGQKFSYLEK